MQVERKSKIWVDLRVRLASGFRRKWTDAVEKRDSLPIDTAFHVVHTRQGGVVQQKEQPFSGFVHSSLQIDNSNRAGVF